MRIVPVPGGTREQFRAVTLSPPFDLGWRSPRPPPTPPLRRAELDFVYLRALELPYRRPVAVECP